MVGQIFVPEGVDVEPIFEQSYRKELNFDTHDQNLKGINNIKIGKCGSAIWWCMGSVALQGSNSGGTCGGIKEEAMKRDHV